MKKKCFWGLTTLFVSLISVNAHAGVTPSVPPPSSIAPSQGSVCSLPKTPFPSTGPTASSIPPHAIILSKEDNVATIVANSPPGSVFFFRPGVYRMQSINAKAGDRFIGALGAELNGSAILANWKPSNGLWTSPAANPKAKPRGGAVCDPNKPTQVNTCTNLEDLFVDDVPYTQVDKLKDLVSGENHFFYDYPHQLIYMADNPKGHTVEISVSYSAFYTSNLASNVTIQNLIVEKYAVPFQFGAIGNQYPGSGWVVENNEVKLGHGSGINVGNAGKILNNHVHNMGQKGIGESHGSGAIVQGNEIDHNVYTSVDCGWECGGTKFSLTQGLLVKGNYSHDNKGPGLWTDVFNINTTYDGNIVVNNLSEGLRHEISYAATIENNIFYNNGTASSQGASQNGQITIANSNNVEIKNNTVIVSDPKSTGIYGSAISFAYQHRDTGIHGPSNQPYGSVDAMTGSSVHDNDITLEGATPGVALWGDYNNGVVANFDGSLNSSNPVFLSPLSTRFFSNRYHVNPTKVTFPYWLVSPDWQTISGNKYLIEQVRGFTGQEVGGSVDFACTSSNASLPTSPSILSSHWTPEWGSLVGYWKLNESAGSTEVTDSSGKGNSGTVKGSVTLGAPGSLTTGASFNGTSGSSIALPEMTLGQNLTIGAWINNKTLTSNAPIFSVMDSQMHYLSFSIQENKSSLGMTDISSKWPEYAVYGSNPVTSGNWHYVTFVIQGNLLSVYLDGILDNARTLSSGPFAGIKGVAAIGASQVPWSPQWYNGTIDELAVWNTSLTAAQIQTIFVHQVPQVITSLSSSWTPEWSSVLGYWKLNESTGSSHVADSSGNGNTGVVNGNVTLGVRGSLTTGASFNGSNGSIALPTMSFSNNFTVSAWINETALTSNMPIFSAFDKNDHYLSLSVQKNGYSLGMSDISSSWPQYSVYGKHPVSAQSWHQVVYVVQGNSLSVYLDGYLDNVQTLAKTSYASMKAQASIGSTSISWAPRWFDGVIDEVAIWNTALSPTEVQLIFAHQAQ